MRFLARMALPAILLMVCPLIASADTLQYKITDYNDNPNSPLAQFMSGAAFTLTFTMDSHGAGCSPGGIFEGNDFFECGGVPVSSDNALVPAASGVVFCIPDLCNHITWNDPNAKLYNAPQMFTGDILSPTFLTGTFRGTDAYSSTMIAVVTDLSPPVAAPEPGSLLLMCTGVSGLFGVLRRKRLR